MKSKCCLINYSREGSGQGVKVPSSSLTRARDVRAAYITSRGRGAAPISLPSPVPMRARRSPSLRLHSRPSPGVRALPGSWLGSRYPEHSAVVLAPTGLLFCMSEFGFCLPFTSEVWRMTECISPRVQQPTTDIQKSILNPAPANPAGQILD